MTNNEGQVFITKTAAAKRQLDAAIRMYLSGEDELAIHTIAAAAYRVLRDLKEKRGHGELADNVRWGLFAFAEDLATGRIQKLPQFLVRDGLSPLVESIADRMRRGEVKTYNDVEILPDWRVERSHWKKFNTAGNFLKHADFDEQKLLADSDLQNDLLLVSASMAYRDIMGDPTPEMFVFGQLWNAEQPDPPGFQPNELCAKLREMDGRERRHYCIRMIGDMKRSDSNNEGSVPFG